MDSDSPILKDFNARDESKLQIKVLDLGTAKFQDVWAKQQSIQRALIEEAADAQETLILCEHPPVITYGKSARHTSLKVDIKDLNNKNNIDVIAIERGGDYTYHGFGQIVAYPLIDLRKRKRDVGWYLRILEECVIETLKYFKISAIRDVGRTGVWIKDNQDSTRKISSLGVRMSRWCTMHGLSLNVLKSSEDGFKFIEPCGLTGVEVTSMESTTATHYFEQDIMQKYYEDVKKILAENLLLKLSI